ncbi:acyltransferase family protein [Pseudomonas sp. IT-P176]|uniref:acyltransferase family protein n=1 Tax=Pseudomonas sp. IT-P176 TaxID=3026444 RepID=UPI0039E15DE9
MERYYGVQYLRGLAAVLVIVYHSMVMSVVAPYFSHPVGEFGVDIFFVISGFVMWVTTEGKGKSPLGFWRSRVLRVVPLYWVFTLMLVAAALLLPALFFNSRGLDVGFVLKSLLFIPARNPDVGDITPVYTIGWTLVYEMFFYLVFGFCLLVKDPRQRFFLVLAVFAGLACCGALFNFADPLLFTYTQPIMLEFVAGVALGYFRGRLPKLNLSMGGLLVVSSMAMLLLVDANQATRFWIYGLPALLLVAGVVALEKTIKTQVRSLPLFFGEVSYSLYLSHPISQRIWYVLFVWLFGQILNEQLALYYFAGSVTVGILGGVVCYYVLEKPLARLTRPRSPLAQPANAL